MKKKKIWFNLIIFLVIVLISTTVFADEITSIMRPDGGGNTQLTQAGGKILGIVQAIGISVAVIMLVVIAIRFMLASANEKAQVKEQLVPYVIGAVLLFGASIFLAIAQSIGAEINKLG